MRSATGIVIPIYIPPGAEAAQRVSLLTDTVAACCAQVDDPSRICLSVDGVHNGAVVVEQLAADWGTSYTATPVNRGKLQGVREGARALLDRADLAYIAVLDCDNDHFGNELLTFVRAAEHIVAQTGDDRLLILGRRLSRHRPMGLLRGELEEIADRMLLHALAYHAALSGIPLRLEYATLIEDVPDFHSGYKIFSRRTAQDVFLSTPEPAGLSDSAYYRHAVEAVMVVEAILHEARLGVVNRTTFNRQPVTAFGLLDRAELTADMILWPCSRLGVPPKFVQQWLDNDLPALLLGTLVPEGRQELEGVYRRVMAALGQDGASSFLQKQPLFL
jgi:hypothetical protein